MLHRLFSKPGLLATALCIIAPVAASNEVNVAPTANGINFPKDYKNWQLIGSSHRTDKNSLRVILGNPIAVQAAREGKTNPWPEGAILAKLAWKDSIHPQFTAATVPGELTHVEFMIKNSTKYATTNGWGFARWLGMAQLPYGKDANFSEECAACHLQAKDTDYVFTQPAQLP
jgi:Cytochrome P460